jgi:flagellar hook assembly protein FlgD
VDLPVARPSLSAAPNPFTRGVELTLGGAGSFDRLEVLDLAGRRVRSFSVQGSSTILWDGHDDQGEEMPAGVYLVRIHGASNTITRRVVKLAR